MIYSYKNGKRAKGYCSFTDYIRDLDKADQMKGGNKHKHKMEREIEDEMELKHVQTFWKPNKPKKKKPLTTFVTKGMKVERFYQGK